MWIGRFWRMLKKWWSEIILNASYSSPKSPHPNHPRTTSRSPGITGPGGRGAWYANRPKSVFYILGPEIKTFEFWYCITQGCEIQEFWRSEISGKSDSSEAMTFRYISDMINLTFFYLKSKDQRNTTVSKYVYFRIKRFIYRGMNKAQILESHSFDGEIMVPAQKFHF